MDPRSWVVCGALLGAIGVATGAYGAHGLKQRLKDQQLDAQTLAEAQSDYNTAVRYQMYHALGMVVIGILTQRRADRWLQAAGFCFMLGIVLFSGMLYSQVLFGQSIHLLIPLGGLTLIIGWCALAVAGCRLRLDIVTS